MGRGFGHIHPHVITLLDPRLNSLLDSLFTSCSFSSRSLAVRRKRINVLILCGAELLVETHYGLPKIPRIRSRDCYRCDSDEILTFDVKNEYRRTDCPIGSCELAVNDVLRDLQFRLSIVQKYKRSL